VVNTVENRLPEASGTGTSPGAGGARSRRGCAKTGIRPNGKARADGKRAWTSAGCETFAEACDPPPFFGRREVPCPLANLAFRPRATFLHRLLRAASVVLLWLLFPAAWLPATPVDAHIEKRVLDAIGAPDFGAFPSDRRCRAEDGYRVALIDNFAQRVSLVPEVMTSHGEVLERLLRSGRSDIDVAVRNTSLGKGLAQVVGELLDGGCVDAVVSSTPGSNYTYGQLSSLLPDGEEVTPENVLDRRVALRGLLRRIAFDGFPSVEWLEGVDVNAPKLRNDARKFALIEALGRFGVPVFLPYGNRDADYRGMARSVNLLSLASNARVFSALDPEGRRIPGFPYSPLSSGEASGVNRIVECPHSADPFKAVLDIDEDGFPDYTFFRTGKIAYRTRAGTLSFAPPVMPQSAFAAWLDRIGGDPGCRVEGEVVLTADQLRAVKAACPSERYPDPSGAYVWLHSAEHGRFFDFEACCWERGTLRGSSLIPPAKAKEWLPAKTSHRK
jgi:hypothetical protein